MSIRRLGPEDAAAFREIRLHALKNEPGAFVSRYEDNVDLSLSEWRAKMRNLILVAAFDDSERPVGLMGAVPMEAPKLRHRAALIMVFLDSDHRGAGLAKNMLDRCIEESQKIGVLQIELEVRADNRRAVDFYTREGFEIIGKRPRAAREGDQFVDDLLMLRILDA